LLGPEQKTPPSLVAGLVGRGLVARLAMQSLLTGQLYVELDVDPARAVAASPAVDAHTLPLIPTEPTRLQTLQAQLQGLDLAQIGQDLAVLARSARQLMAGPEPERALARTADAAQALQRLALRLEGELGPLSASARQTLAGTQRTLQQLGQGAQQVGDAATTVQGQVRSVAQGIVPLTEELRRTAEELSLAASTLREAAAGDSSLRLGADRALQDVSRAARALRELSETVERQPDLLLRGRAPAPAAP
jgi:paraquat-inducible protein B